MTTAPEDLGTHYGRIRERLCALLTTLDPGEDATPVAACEGWTVHDVVAHLVGIIEDAVAGRLSGVPTPQLTAAQVERHRGTSLDALMRYWSDAAPFFQPVLTERAIWPAVLDVLTHEHDIRTALRRPGGRDDPFVAIGAARLRDTLYERVRVEVHLRDHDVLDSRRPHHGRPVEGSVPSLQVDAFEFLRLRLGRRSVAQVRSLAWSGDPTRVLDDLFVFGPRTSPLLGETSAN